MLNIVVLAFDGISSGAWEKKTESEGNVTLMTSDYFVIIIASCVQQQQQQNGTD